MKYTVGRTMIGVHGQYELSLYKYVQFDWTMNRNESQSTSKVLRVSFPVYTLITFSLYIGVYRYIEEWLLK